MISDTQRVVIADIEAKRVSSEQLSQLNRGVQAQASQVALSQTSQAPPNISTSQPVDYSSDIRQTNKGGYNETKANYLPVEVIKDSNGNITKIIYRDVYETYVTQDGRIQQFSVYDKKIETYQDNKLISVKTFEPYEDKRTDKYVQNKLVLKEDLDYSSLTGYQYETPRTKDIQTGVSTSTGFIPYSQNRTEPSKNVYIPKELPGFEKGTQITEVDFNTGQIKKLVGTPQEVKDYTEQFRLAGLNEREQKKVIEVKQSQPQFLDFSDARPTEYKQNLLFVDKQRSQKTFIV